MRLSRLLLTAATALAAVSAIAQDPPAEAQPEPAVEAPPAGGLSDLRSTVDELQDAPAPAVEAPATPADEPTSPARAPAETPAPATPRPAPPAEPLTGEQQAALAAAGRRGEQMIAIARAGIIGTQDMLSRVSNPEEAGIVGWIAEPEGNATEIIFYARGEAGPVAVFRASILGPRVVSREVFLQPAERPPLNPIEARMAQARDATETLDHQPCGGQAFNVLVIPPSSATAPVDVYQMSPATQRGRFPLGGHFKATIGPDGTVTATRGFTNACVNLDVPEAPAGQPTRPLAVTHLLDPLPTEVHVFLSLWTGRPLLVVAGDPQRIFLVAGERITELRDRPQGR